MGLVYLNQDHSDVSIFESRSQWCLFCCLIEIYLIPITILSVFLAI